MNTRHSTRISRSAAELLLDGHAGPDPDQLARVLAAAAAPARDSELAGEQMAVAAFEANHLVPVATPQKEHKTMLAKLLTAKVILTSMAALGTGGVALAASTGALPGTGSATVNTSQPAAVPTQMSTAVPGANGGASSVPTKAPSTHVGSGTGTRPPLVPSPTASASATKSPSATASPSATSQSLPQGATALCQALIADLSPVSGGTLTQSGEIQALSSSNLPAVLANPEFSSLIATAQSASTVADYCALLLDLPQLPDPSAVAQLPNTLLGQLLTALPTSTLSQVLTSLPSSTLGQVLTELPTSTLSTVLTDLPTSTVSQLLGELPTSVLTQLPTSVLSQLPTSVTSLLPIPLLSGL
jgi:hypothetical protein